MTSATTTDHGAKPAFNCGVSLQPYCESLAELFEVQPGDLDRTIRACLNFVNQALQPIGSFYFDEKSEVSSPNSESSVSAETLEQIRRCARDYLGSKDYVTANIGSEISFALESAASKVSLLPIKDVTDHRAIILVLHKDDASVPTASLVGRIGKLCGVWIGRSLEHIELQRISQSRRIQIEFLKQVLSVSQSEFPRTYDDILLACEQLIESLHSVVWLVNRRTNTLTLRAQRGADDSILKPVLDIKGSLTGRAYIENDILFYPDIWDPTIKDIFQSWDKARSLNLHGMVTIPVRKGKDRRREDIVAILSIFPKAPQFEFNKEELEIVSTEIGAALRIARDYEREAMLDGLIQGANESKDLNSYLYRVARFIKDSMKVEGTSIFVWDEPTRRLQLGGTTGISPKKLKSQIFYLSGEGLTGKVFADREPLDLDERFESHKRKGAVPKFVEDTPHDSGPVLMVPILKIERASFHSHETPTPSKPASIGVIRCANKLTYVGNVIDSFSDADLDILKYASRIIAPYTELVQTEHRRVALLSRISHEILSPIVSIRGTASLIVQKSAEQRLNLVEAVSLASDILVHATILRMLCGGINIVNASTAGLLSYQKQDLRIMEDVIYPAIDMIKPIARSQHLQFDSVQASGPLGFRIVSDQLALQQIVFNLLTNSVKYHRRGMPQKFLINVDCKVQGGSCFITVSDNGMGIDPSEADLIFDYGYRGKETNRIDAKGIGLGLFICKTIAEGLKGSLKLMSYSQPTSFRLQLPMKS
jgi:signal transduction histidine kinase